MRIFLLTQFYYWHIFYFLTNTSKIYFLIDHHCETQSESSDSVAFVWIVWKFPKGAWVAHRNWSSSMNLIVSNLRMVCGKLVLQHEKKMLENLYKCVRNFYHFSHNEKRIWVKITWFSRNTKWTVGIRNCWNVVKLPSVMCWYYECEA